MEPLIEELLKKHNKDKDLTGPKVQQEVKKLREKYNRTDKTLKDDEQLVGLVWIDADLKDFILHGLKLSYNQDNKKANFYRAHLEQSKLNNVTAQGAIFKNSFLTGADLSNSNFDHSNFISSQLDIVNLKNSRLFYARLNNVTAIGAQMENTLMTYANIENANFIGSDIEKSIDLEFANFNKLNEDEGYQSRLIYLSFENYLGSKGFKEKASKCYYRRRILETNNYLECWKRDKKDRKALRAWFIHRFWGFLCGYGDDPLRVLRAWGITILISMILYFIFWGGLASIINKNLSEIWQIGINSIYFSGVTFTTLGFGDLYPDPNIPLMKIVAMCEAFFGAFLMALFAVTLSRKMIR